MKTPEGSLEPWVALVPVLIPVLVSIRSAQGVLIMCNDCTRGAGVTRYCNIIDSYLNTFNPNICPEGTACSTSCDATGEHGTRATLFPA